MVYVLTSLLLIPENPALIQIERNSPMNSNLISQPFLFFDADPICETVNRVHYELNMFSYSFHCRGRLM